MLAIIVAMLVLICFSDRSGGSASLFLMFWLSAQRSALSAAGQGVGGGGDEEVAGGGRGRGTAGADLQLGRREECAPGPGREREYSVYKLLRLHWPAKK